MTWLRQNKVTIVELVSFSASKRKYSLLWVIGSVRTLKVFKTCIAKSSRQDDTSDKKLPYSQFQVLNLYHLLFQKNILGAFAYTGIVYGMFIPWGILGLSDLYFDCKLIPLWKSDLFLHKNTHHTIPCKKLYFYLSIHFSFSSTTSAFVSLYRSKVSNSSWWRQEIPNEIIQLCIDYDVAFRLEKKKWKLKEVILQWNFLCGFFLYKLLKNLHKYYFKFVWLPGKKYYW